MPVARGPSWASRLERIGLDNTAPTSHPHQPTPRVSARGPVGRARSVGLSRDLPPATVAAPLAAIYGALGHAGDARLTRGRTAYGRKDRTTTSRRAPGGSTSTVPSAWPH